MSVGYVTSHCYGSVLGKIVGSSVHLRQIRRNGTVVSSFTLDDVVEDRMMYEMVNWTSAFDVMYVTASDHFDNVVEDIEIWIEFLPRMTLSKYPVQIKGSTSLTLTLREMDASELEQITGVVPVYNVTILPRLGDLVGPEQQREEEIRRRRRRLVKRDEDNEVKIRLHLSL